MVGGDQRDRLALVAHDVDGQHRLVEVLEADRVEARHVVGGQDGVDARRREGRADVDRRRIRACGCGLRRVTPQNMSSMNRSLE